MYDLNGSMTADADAELPQPFSLHGAHFYISTSDHGKIRIPIETRILHGHLEIFKNGPHKDTTKKN
jgi:hypothetical protein